MPSDRTPPSNIPAEIIEQGGEVRPLRPDEVPQALAPDLVPVVDDIRQLYTTFGLRPYRVFLVHMIWPTQVGNAAGVEISRREILPTPRVRDMSATNEVLKATGLTEEGGISIDQISAKFSEDDLMGRTPDLQDPALLRTSLANVEFFWEVAENRAVEPLAVRRRYVPSAAPFLSRDGFQWSVSLTRQDADRGRRGQALPRSVF